MNEDSKVKEYKAKCKICGADYLLQGTKEELEKYLSIETFMCPPGRHVELGPVRAYLEIISESEKLSELPKIEPKKPNECEAYELPKGLEHIGFGTFKDPNTSDIYDYRLGPKGERFYSKQRSG